jgi:hypothetical protein
MTQIRRCNANWRLARFLHSIAVMKLMELPAVLLSIAIALASGPLLGQQPDSPDRGDKINSPGAHIPRQQAPPPEGQQQQNADRVATNEPTDNMPGHRPPDNRWHAPIAALAGLLGITALLSHLGFAGPVASAIGGIVVIALLILIIFLVWWRMVRKYGISGRVPRR